MWVQAVSLLCLFAGAEDDPPTVPIRGPSQYWRQVLDEGGRKTVACRNAGTRRVASAPAAKSVEPHKVAPQPAEREAEEQPVGMRARVARLRQRMRGAEEKLLYSTLPEERALEYNAGRRREMRILRESLLRLRAERSDVLGDLSRDYRRLLAADRPLLGQRWLQRNRAAVLRQIQAYVRSDHRVADLDRALASLDETDRRLRELIASKHAEREDSRREKKLQVDESFTVDLPTPALEKKEPTLSRDELEIFRKFFPADGK